jgi:putative Mn2+ efflux pump MntP
MSPWTKIASTIALGIGANSENLPVGLAYGMRGMPIGLTRNVAIALLTTLATLVPLAIGREIRGSIPEALPDALSGFLLIGLGLLNIWIDRRRPFQALANPARRQGRARRLSPWETLVLAGALSLNNVGLGFAGGIAGLDHVPVALSVGGFSVLLLWAGERLSRVRVLPLSSQLGRLTFDGNFLIIAAGVLIIAGL